MALTVEEFGWGLLHKFKLPYWPAVVLSIVILDFSIYPQHVMFHAIPALWRLHIVHHADVDFDVTTGIRFHPIEIVLSMLIKLAVVAVVGPPVLGVLLFEVLLNALAMFNHGNVRIAPRFERSLRWIIVTPDMHRVHHSVDGKEYSTNFGFNLSCWDRLLGTYLDQPAEGHEGMTINGRPFLGIAPGLLPWAEPRSWCVANKRQFFACLFLRKSPRSVSHFLRNPIRKRNLLHFVLSSCRVHLAYSSETLCLELRAKSYQRWPDATMNVSDLPIHETADEMVWIISQCAGNDEDFLTFGIAPPASLDRTTRNYLGDARNTAPRTFKYDAVLS